MLRKTGIAPRYELVDLRFRSDWSLQGDMGLLNAAQSWDLGDGGGRMVNSLIDPGDCSRPIELKPKVAQIRTDSH